MAQQSRFRLAINNNDIVSTTSKVVQKKTIVLTQSAQLKTGDNITIHFSKINFLKDSIYSILRIDDIKEEQTNKQNSKGFYIPISARTITDLQTTRSVELSLKELQKDLNPPYYISSNAITDRNDPIVKVANFGLYMVSLNLEVSSKDVDIFVVIEVGSVIDIAEVTTDAGISVKFKTTDKNENYNLQFNGILLLRSNTDFRITIHSTDAITIKKQSYFSIASVRLITFASTAKIKLNSDDNGLDCKKIWLPLTGLSPENKFYLDRYLPKSQHKFVTPTDGVYFVYAKIGVKPMTNLFQNVRFAIQHNDFLTGNVMLYETITSIKAKLDVITVTNVMELKRGDELQLLINCSAVSKRSEDVDLKVILLETMEQAIYLIAERIQDNDWKILSSKSPGRINKIITSESGYYLVTANILFNVTPKDQYNSDEVIITLYVYSVKDSKELGLKVQKNITLNDKQQNTLTMYATGFLELNKGDEIDMLIESSNRKVDVQYEQRKISFISVTSTYGFKSIQTISKYIKFRNGITSIGNIQSSEYSGGYRLPKSEFFGSYFVVNKPITLLYDVTVQLKVMTGKYKPCFRIRPKRGIVDISEFVSAKDKTSITLKAVGIIQLETGETVELIVIRSTNVDKEPVLCTRSSWSMMELFTLASKGIILNYYTQEL